MEQPSGKKERVITALGLAAALALAAAQQFCPASRALRDGRDLRLALLGERTSMLLVYQPYSSTVKAFPFSHGRPKKGATGWQRTIDLSAQAGAPAEAGRDEVFYVSLSTAPELDAVWSVLNGWRNRPGLFFSSAKLLDGLRRSGATNLGRFDMFSVFSEAARLGSSNFVVSDTVRQQAVPGGEAADEGAPAPRVEVFNASGRPGLAAKAARFLRGRGFDVITEGSAPREARTRILGFSADTADALKLRSALGLEEMEIRVKTSQKSVAGAAVVMGEDFSEAALAE